jgi:FMN-dependent NADH-azoreductase
MTQILHVDSSARGASSHSRTMSAELVGALKSAHPDATVAYRDLHQMNIPFVTETEVFAYYTAPDQRTPDQKAAIQISDTLVDELLASDVLVFGVPMYNFSVPAAFKAYIDQVFRVGRTFSPSYEGLVKGKKAFIVTARGGGGYGPGEQREQANFEDPYLKTALGFIGITDVTFLHVNNTASGDEIVQASLTGVRDQIKSAAASV